MQYCSVKSVLASQGKIAIMPASASFHGGIVRMPKQLLVRIVLGRLRVRVRPMIPRGLCSRHARLT